MCRYRETECDKVMGRVMEQEALVIYVLTRHKVINSCEIVRAGQAVWGIDKCAQNVVRIPGRKRRSRTWVRLNCNTKIDFKKYG
jgi:hypothetical protein